MTSPPQRYRTRRVRLLVHAPGEGWVDVDAELVHDRENGTIGVHVTGDNPHRGTIIFVAEDDIQAVKASGKPADTLEAK